MFDVDFDLFSCMIDFVKKQKKKKMLRKNISDEFEIMCCGI